MKLPARQAGPAEGHGCSTTVAPRLTAALCLCMLVVAAWALNRITDGFEVWTFEGRRQLLLQTGHLQAPTVALRGLDQQQTILWADAAAPPAAYLVDFIYTRCPSICLALGSEYQQMQRLLSADVHDPATQSAGSGGVHLVSISFDVALDGPPQLAQYAARLQADPRLWTFAVPATANDANRLLGGLGVVAVPDGQGGFVHNGAIHLLDSSGTLRGLFALDAWQQALTAARALAASARVATR